MFPYRKILELHGDNVSLRSIAQIVQHSRQKVTEVCLWHLINVSFSN